MRDRDRDRDRDIAESVRECVTVARAPRVDCARVFWLGRAGTKEVQDATREKELAEIRMSAQTALEQEAAKRELVRVSAAPTKCETFGSTRINCHPTTTLRSQEKKEADVKMIKERSERLLARHTLN